MSQLMLQLTSLGAEWVMWLLIALSFVSVALIIERWIFFYTRKVDVDQLSLGLSDALRTHDIDRAKKVVSGSKAIECVVVLSGLNAMNRGVHGVAEIMHSTKARERLRLEAYLPFLGTLGNNAPFVGLLGTVIGIIRASLDLSAAQAAKQAGASAVMAGVFEALVATAVGLCVALPAVVAYNTYQRRGQKSLLQVDVLAHLLISYMKPRSEGLVPSAPIATLASSLPPKLPQGA